MRDALLGQVGALVAAAFAAALGCGSSAAPQVAKVIVAAPALPAPSAPAAEPSAPESVAGAPRQRNRGGEPAVWLTSEPEARALARERGMPFVVYACAAWSAACAEMDRKVIGDPRVVAQLRGFVALKLDLTDTEGEAELYARRYDVTGLPMIVLFDAQGRRVAALTGYLDAPSLARELERASE